MTPAERVKLTRFLNDDLMQQSVYLVLQRAFLRSEKDWDVQKLAASRIALDMLREAWKDLEKNRSDPDAEEASTNNIAL